MIHIILLLIGAVCLVIAAIFAIIGVFVLSKIFIQFIRKHDEK